MPRADALRNREKLLEVAFRAFARDGAEVTLDAIAREAGVGIGTLYRHFPNREALVVAVYHNELARLCDAAPELLREAPPDIAMRQWMDHFVAYLGTKRDMADALRAVVASGGNPYAHSRDRMVAAITALLAAGADAGTVRSDVEPLDVLMSLSGISVMAGDDEQRARTGRVLDLLMDGLRYRASLG